LKGNKGGNQLRKWLKEIREKKGLSQYQVAKQARLSQSYYAGIESGNRGHKLPVKTAKRIANVLGFNWTRFYETEEAVKTGTDD
jgi:transcriptional regulator with XRE-family HTH domain